MYFQFLLTSLSGFAPTIDAPPPGVGIKVITTDPEGAIIYARDSGLVPNTFVGKSIVT